jgi:uncharacterized protein (DUF342 family)
MVDTPDIQVTYNARLRRARIQFRVADCLRYRKPPHELISKIQQRLEEDLEDGFIETYVIFLRRLEELWGYIRSQRDELQPERVIRVTIAQGGRLYPDIELRLPDHAEGKCLALLSCKINVRKMTALTFNTFLFNIIRQLEHLKISRKPDRAQLRFLYLLAKNGQALDQVPLKIQAAAEDYPDKNFMVRLDTKHHYASLHIFNSQVLASRARREELMQRTERMLKGMNTAQLHLHILQEHTREKIHSLASKMQGFGFNMPYDLLIAYDARYRFESEQLEQDKQIVKQDDAEPPRWRLRALGQSGASAYFDFEMDPDGMQASISKVRTAALDEVRSQISKEWLVGELARQGIVFGYEEYLEEWWNAIQERRRLEGIRVASGEKPQAGQKAYLHILATDLNELPKDRVDMREVQNRLLIRQGQRIAELRFEDGTPGKDIYGKPCHALAQVNMTSFQAGEGVRVAADGRFYATRDGLLEVEGQVVNCQAAYVHPGSVNLASGNLVFDGSVVIQGDIESGAYVQVKGQLVVEGMIGPSRVQCSGTVTVKGGVVTGPTGWLRAGGELRCEFVENSQIEAKGSLLVQRSVLNSTVIVGGFLHILDEGQGLVAGGLISSWSGIRAARCGLGPHQSTVCRIGSNFSQERRLLRLQRRQQRLQTYHDQLQKSLRDFDASQKSSPGAAPEFQKQMQIRLQKSLRILEKITQLLQIQEQKLLWNQRATLHVSGRLDRSVDIFAAGKRIPLDSSLQAVLISAASFRGSPLVDLGAIEDFRRTFPDALIAGYKQTG